MSTRDDITKVYDSSDLKSKFVQFSAYKRDHIIKPIGKCKKNLSKSPRKGKNSVPPTDDEVLFISKTNRNNRSF